MEAAFDKSQFYPAEIANYVPPKEDVKWFSEKKGHRLIFVNQPLDQFEKQELEKFRQRVIAKKIQLPPWADDEFGLPIRFLESEKWKTDKAIEGLVKHVEWVQATLPIPYERVQGLLNTGCTYFFGRSLKFNPIWIINVKKFVDSPVDESALFECCTFLCDFAKNNLLVPGKAEQWIMIIDCKGVNIKSLLGTVNKINKNVGVHYPSTLYRNFSINVPKSMEMIWYIVKQFLHVITCAKIKLISDNFQTAIQELVHPDKLEKRFGGNVPDLTSNFFPPQMMT